jgi:hypothetical protein
MSSITDLFEDTIDEFSWRAGYDQAVIDDTKKIVLALDVIAYLNKENERLRAELAGVERFRHEDSLVECAECGSQFLWWQEQAHQASKCGVE